MFSGLTSYLFGETPDASTLNYEEDQAGSRLHVKPTPDDSDWVLVDTSRENSPQRMETSPMEDLLIEHPSMSVYGPRGRPSSTGADSNISESSTDDNARLADQASSGQVHRQPPRRPRAVAARAGLVAHVQSVKTSQRAVRRHLASNLTKNNLRRSNQVRAARTTGHPNRQKFHLRQPTARCAQHRC